MNEPSFIAMLKTRLKPPSASLRKLVMSEACLFIDDAAFFFGIRRR
jgi:hypothetical protein